MKKPESQENEPPINLEIDYKQVIYALSDSLDFVGVDEIHHGKRVGLMARECAKAMGWTENEVSLLFEIGLLHDCGVSSTRIHRHLISEFDWSNSQAHCEVGYNLLKNINLFQPLALPIKYHHTHWKQLEEVDIDPKVRQFANIIFLADRVDILAAHHYGRDILVAREDIRQSITQKIGDFFYSEINEAFWEAAEKQAFWLSLTPEHLTYHLSEIRKKTEKKSISARELKEIALMFSQIVDAKSAFTMEHSAGVARLARFLGEEIGLSKEILFKIEIAGLLHDLGKLKIPDEILEKRGPLSKQERSVIEEHSFETFEILGKITGIEDVARWAAYHHERPDGKGYPFQVDKSQLEIEALIICASDVFQALIQNRPYRPALSIREALSIMGEMAREGSLDQEVVHLIEKNAPACYEYAIYDLEII